MVNDLMRTMKSCCRGWVLLSLCAIPVISSAQALVDPMRPATELSGRTREETSDLQSIIISPTRRAAIINGQTVELGGKVGDVKLIEVSERGVVLQGEKGRQVLTLFPNVKINKKAAWSPMNDDVENSVRKEYPVDKPNSRTGMKEKK